jgi:prepilin-type N-terminal cleavage/methylation domain-containing protein
VTGRVRFAGSEAGFTLPEVLIVIAILGIIVVSLTNAMVVGLRSSSRTATVLVASADRQMLTTYFPPDALSATTATADPAAVGCTGVTGDRVLLLAWSEFDPLFPQFPTSFFADYRLIPGGTGKELVRDSCVGSVPADEIKVAHDATAAIPVFPGGTTVGIQVTDSLGAQYTVSGSRRAA